MFFSVGGTFRIRTFDIVDTRQCRVKFGIFIDDMIEIALSLFQLCTENTETFISDGFIFMFTVSAIIDEFCVIFGIETDVIHIITLSTEFHCMY